MKCLFGAELLGQGELECVFVFVGRDLTFKILHFSLSGLSLILSRFRLILLNKNVRDMYKVINTEIIAIIVRDYLPADICWWDNDFICSPIFHFDHNDSTRLSVFRNFDSKELELFFHSQL